MGENGQKEREDVSAIVDSSLNISEADVSVDSVAAKHKKRRKKKASQGESRRRRRPFPYNKAANNTNLDLDNGT